MANLIFVYGPPASGKLTVAKELAKQTGYSLFHNHLTFDMAAAIYEKWTPDFTNYCSVLRTDGIRRAMIANNNLIFTFCYVCPDDDVFVKQVIDIVTNHSGTLHFVKLNATIPLILSRVENPSRQKYAKISNKQKLQKYVTDCNCFATITYSKSLDVDITTLSLLESVEMIINYIRGA